MIASPRSGRRLPTAALLSEPIEFIPSPEFGRDSTARTIGPVDGLLADDRRETGPATSSSRFPRHLLKLCEARLLSAAEEGALFRRMNFVKYRANLLREELAGQKSSRSQIRKLRSLLAEAEAIRERLIRANMRLVVSVTKKFVEKGVTLDELVSEGTMSLIRAVEKFDYSRGFRFSTYATYAIRRNLYRWVIGRRKQRGVTGGDSAEMLEGVAEENAYDGFTPLQVDALRAVLESMLGKLDERERFIVRARFGMDGLEKPRTLESLAAEMGVCKERVRQLQMRAMKKLRALAPEMHLEAP